MRCGHEGDDVRMRSVDLEREAKEDGERLGTVSVTVVTSQDRMGVRGAEVVEVPARYGYEPRCVDGEACRGRVAASKRDGVTPTRVILDEREPAPWE